jgi:UDP-N-acetylmuramoyl-tripeptide--D-alanyl-D-alanine ligase
LDFVATDMEICFWQCAVTGLSFKLNYEGKVIPVRLGHVCAKHLAHAALAALAVADQLHINTIDAAATLADFVASPGRMRLLDGINGSLVIDDTYNASPRAMKAAIETLSSAPAKRTIAVLGDMRELGTLSQKEHERIAQYIMTHKIDVIFLVGDEMKNAYDALSGKKEKVMHFARVEDAVTPIVQEIHKDDVVLVKGSRGIHMEVIARAIVIDRSQTL